MRQLDPNKYIPFANNNYDSARFLCHLLMLNMEFESEEWIPIPFKDWEKEHLSRYAVEKAREFFVNIGVLDYKVKKYQGNPTTHYRVNYTILAAHLDTTT